MNTASIQVIVPCTILEELLGGTGKGGHGWGLSEPAQLVF